MKQVDFFLRKEWNTLPMSAKKPPPLSPLDEAVIPEEEDALIVQTELAGGSQTKKEELLEAAQEAAGDAAKAGRQDTVWKIANICLLGTPWLGSKAISGVRSISRGRAARTSAGETTDELGAGVRKKDPDVPRERIEVEDVGPAKRCAGILMGAIKAALRDKVSVQVLEPKGGFESTKLTLGNQYIIFRFSSSKQEFSVKNNFTKGGAAENFQSKVEQGMPGYTCVDPSELQEQVAEADPLEVIPDALGDEGVVELVDDDEGEMDFTMQEPKKKTEKTTAAEALVAADVVAGQWKAELEKALGADYIVTEDGKGSPAEEMKITVTEDDHAKAIFIIKIVNGKGVTCTYRTTGSVESIIDVAVANSDALVDAKVEKKARPAKAKIKKKA